MADENHDVDSRLRGLTSILEDIKDLLVLQTITKQDEIRKWIDTIFGKSLRLKQVYCSVDGESSTGDIAKSRGMMQKNVSTALTHLFKAGLLDIVKPYKRGFIYQRKLVYESLGIVDYIESLMEDDSISDLPISMEEPEN